MILSLSELLFLLGGLLAGALLAWGFLRLHGSGAQAVLVAEAAQIPVLRDELRQSREHFDDLRNDFHASQQTCAELQTRLTLQQQEFARREQLLLESRQLFEREFHQVASRLLDEKSERITLQNRTQVGELLSPLREQLQDFRRKVEDVYDKESKDRVALHREISLLRDLNVRISHEAENLVKALKGDNKAQGNWGELVLERVLELSGLVKGREFEVQASYRTADGQWLRPDVVVHLPDGKDVVIDSKVSLLHWDAYCAAQNDNDAAEALRGHVQSLRAHVRGLSGKQYENLPGLRSLDFVLLFIPIEAAFLKLMEAEPEVFTEAYAKGLMLVCPSTLLATLRTIQNLWRYEYQNRNALRIAECAGGLHDQFVMVIDSIKELGDRLSKTSQSYDNLWKRMVDGKGNVIKRVAELESLGAKTRRKLSREEGDAVGAPGDTSEATNVEPMS
jgi:DNA recombination protein RmuC